LAAPYCFGWLAAEGLLRQADSSVMVEVFVMPCRTIGMIVTRLSQKRVLMRKWELTRKRMLTRGA
jgi:hypothetical protein